MKFSSSKVVFLSIERDFPGWRGNATKNRNVRWLLSVSLSTEKESQCTALMGWYRTDAWILIKYLERFWLLFEHFFLLTSSSCCHLLIGGVFLVFEVFFRQKLFSLRSIAHLHTSLSIPTAKTKFTRLCLKCKFLSYCEIELNWWWHDKVYFSLERNSCHMKWNSGCLIHTNAENREQIPNNWKGRKLFMTSFSCNFKNTSANIFSLELFRSFLSHDHKFPLLNMMSNFFLKADEILLFAQSWVDDSKNTLHIDILRNDLFNTRCCLSGESTEK